MSSQIMEWYYAGDADITYGEVHVSPLPKILLAISVIFIVSAGVSGFIFRDTIYDLFNNPRVILLSQTRHDDGNYIEVPYKYDFDAKKFIDEDIYAGYYELLDIKGEVDTNKLGEYQVEYVSKNKIKTNTEVLTVYVKDITAPKIKLKAVKNAVGEYNPIVLVRGAEDDDQVLGTESFDANKYIDSITDDYSKSDKIKVVHTGESVNFGSSGTTTATVIYTAIDEAGNESQESLSLVIMDDYDAAAKAQEDRINQMAAELAALTGGGYDQYSNEDGSNTSTVGNVELSADPITWSISADGEVSKLATSPRGIHYINGNGQAWPIDGPGYTYQPDGPGTYTRTWECTEGLQVTQTVTLVD